MTAAIVHAHRIQRQVLHVDIHGAEADGMAVQRIVSGLCQGALPQALEEVLERVAPRQGDLCIERLDLDIGCLALEHLKEELAGSIAQAVEKAIREQAQIVAKPQGLQGQAATARSTTAEQNVHEAFVCFLQTGRLPWSFRLAPGTHLEQAVLEVWAVTYSPAARRILDHDFLRVLGSATARQRLVSQFSPGFLALLMARLSPEAGRVVDTVVRTLRSTPEPTLGSGFEREIWNAAFGDVAAGDDPTATSLVATAWQRHWRSLPPAKLANLIEQHWPGVTNAATGPSSGVRAADLRAGRPLAAPAGDESGDDLDALPGFYVDNAGLVLLHPFLPQFFSVVGVADSNELIDPQRALCLLHYLSTGESLAPEYALTLPKILCNIPLDTPVAADVPLMSDEMAEATVLLEAVIHHWDALRDTSPDGLRGTFLLRSGKVSRQGDGEWLLQVEMQTCDILLDQLPWGLSMIKLPWMDRSLRVEWR